jgi:hypothetical protein
MSTMGVEEDTSSRGRTVIALGVGLVAGIASLFIPSPTSTSDQDIGAKTESGTTTEKPARMQTRYDFSYAPAEMTANRNRDYNRTPPTPKPKKDYTPREAIVPSPLRMASFADTKDIYARPPTRNNDAGRLGSRTTSYYRRMNMV